jgi:hypothetical protein
MDIILTQPLSHQSIAIYRPSNTNLSPNKLAKMLETYGEYGQDGGRRGGISGQGGQGNNGSGNK